MSRCEQFWEPAQIFAKLSLGLGFLGTESRGRILLKLLSLGLGFSNKGLGVSASLGFYNSPPLLLLDGGGVMGVKGLRYFAMTGITITITGI